MTQVAFEQKGWTVTKVKDEGLNREYKVIIASNILTERVQSSLGEIAAQASLPGFRAGKVPVALIEKRYGGSVVAEVLEKLTQETVQQLFVKEDIQPLTRPHVVFDSYEKEKDFTFSVSAEIFPPIELADFSTYNLEKPVVEHNNTDVDDIIKASLIKAVESKDDTVKDNHYIIGKSVAKSSEGHEVALYTGEAIDFMITLSDKDANKRTTENSKQFIGMKMGETRSVTFTPPEEHLGVLNVDFTLNKIMDIEQPEPTDALAAEKGYKDLADWREEMKASIDSRFDREAKEVMHKSILKLLETTHNFTMPGTLLAQELHGLTYDLMGSKGIEVKALPHKHEDGSECTHDHGHDHEDPSHITKTFDYVQEQAKEHLSADELAKLKTRAERRVKLALVIAALCRKHNIAVSDVELQRAVKRLAQANPKQAKYIEELYTNNLRMREELRAPMVEKKALDFILSLAKVSDKKMSRDDYFAWVDAQMKDMGEDL